MNLRELNWSEVMVIVMQIQEHNDNSTKILIFYLNYEILQTQTVREEES